MKVNPEKRFTHNKIGMIGIYYVLCDVKVQLIVVRDASCITMSFGNQISSHLGPMAKGKFMYCISGSTIVEWVRPFIMLI